MRTHAVKAASRRHSDSDWPLRLGYSPFLNHDLMSETLKAYQEIVPEGRVNYSSDCTAQLIDMLHDGRLDAAIVTLPVNAPDLAEHFVCEDNMLICLRRDDPAAAFAEIPKEAIAVNLRILFNRTYHPELHDLFLKTFRKAGIVLKITETYSAPSEMQFLVKGRGCFGLIREGIPVDAELTTRPMEGISLHVRAALMCHREQQRPVLPMLAYRMSQLCRDKSQTGVPKKPSSGVRNAAGSSLKKAR